MRDYLRRDSLFGLFSPQAVESNYGMGDLCHTISTEGQHAPCDHTNYNNLTITMLLVMLRTLKYITRKKNVFTKMQVQDTTY